MLGWNEPRDTLSNEEIFLDECVTLGGRAYYFPLGVWGRGFEVVEERIGAFIKTKRRAERAALGFALVVSIGLIYGIEALFPFGFGSLSFVVGIFVASALLHHSWLVVASFGASRHFRKISSPMANRETARIFALGRRKDPIFCLIALITSLPLYGVFYYAIHKESDANIAAGGVALSYAAMLTAISIDRAVSYSVGRRVKRALSDVKNPGQGSLPPFSPSTAKKSG